MKIKENCTNFLVIFDELIDCTDIDRDPLFMDLDSDAVLNLKHHKGIIRYILITVVHTSRYMKLMTISTNFFSFFFGVLFFGDPCEEVPSFEVGSEDDLEYLIKVLPRDFVPDAGCDSLRMPNHVNNTRGKV